MTPCEAYRGTQVYFVAFCIARFCVFVELRNLDVLKINFSGLNICLSS